MKTSPRLALVPSLCSLALLMTSSAQAKLLGYWNFDGPPTVVQGTDNSLLRAADTKARLSDLSGNNYHGNDRNIAIIGSRVLFNNNDVPRAPFLVPPGNTNYCLDLASGNVAGNNKYVVMEGATGVQAGSSAVTSAGDAFNLGNTAAASAPSTIGKLTVGFWFKGLSPNAYGDYVAKGGETYGTLGLQGWSVRKFNASSRLCFTLRNTLFGDSDPAMDYMARSGGTLVAPLFNNVAISDTNGQVYSDNIANGIWQHAVMVYDGTWIHHYVNGLHVRSAAITTTNTYTGTTALLSFGQNMIADSNTVFATARYGQCRLDEICIFDEALTPMQVEDLARGSDPRQPLRNSIRPFDFAWPAGSPARQGLQSIYPVNQGSAAAIDNNTATDYLNLSGRYSGLIVVPTLVTNVQSFTITTSNSLPGRDPTSYEIFGTNGALTSVDNSGGRAGGTEAWTLLASGAMSLPAARATSGTPIGFTNATAYTNYKIVFPTLASEMQMQIAEIKFFTANDGSGTALAITSSRAIAEISQPTGHSACPGQEGPKNVLDGVVGTKCLNFAGPSSGFIFTPAAASIVKTLKLTTANDTPARDPSSYALYGTNDAIASLNHSGGTGENWTLIQGGRLYLTVARITVNPVIGITNSTSYTSYKLVFPTSGGDLLFQIADVYLYASTDGTGSNLLAPGQPIRAVNDYYMAPNSAGSWMSGYTGGPILPQGGPGTVGIFEMRANGNLKRPEGQPTGTNATVYANESPPLYARFGSANQFQGLFGVTANYPYGRLVTSDPNAILDYGDDNSSTATGYNGRQNEILTSVVGTAHDQLFQMTQGCFHVNAPGRYTFTMRSDDGSQLAIAGGTWVNRYADNGSGSYVGELLQNGYPTGDTGDIGVFEFPAAGDYNFRHLWNEQAGGAWDEVLYAPGELSAYNPTDFRNIGNSAGGITLVDHKPIMAITANTLFVNGGVPSSFNLTWDASYATTVTLSGGIYGAGTNVTSKTINGYGSAASVASPGVTTTYTVTGVRNGGTPVSKSVTVYIDSPPIVLSVTSPRSMLPAGAPLTLRWAVAGGVTFSLTDSVTGTPINVTANTAPGATQNGSITFTAPATSRTYSITATNTYGTSAAGTIFVEIGVAPILTLTLDRATLLKGSNANLTWTASADAQSPTITPRLTNASLSPLVALNGTSPVSPELTTTYTFTAFNTFGTSSVSATVTMPERIGVDAAGWTVEMNYWNRFGYTDPVYGSRTTVAYGFYQMDEMLAITDAALGARGPLAGTFTDPLGKTVAGPATPPSAQPGTGEKILMRYRQANVANPNYNDVAGSVGFIGGDIIPPPALGSVTYDQYTMTARANLVVNVPGTYPLGIANDDGGRLRIDFNKDGDFTDAGELVILNESPGGFTTNPVWSTAVSLTPGSYPIEYSYFEGSGGSGGEIFFMDAADSCRIKSLPIIASPIGMPAAADVVISEFMAANSQTLNDGEGSSPDWIELYNGSGSAISLNGYYLTDKSVTPNKWAFPATASIPANGYLIVFASGKGDRVPPPPAGELHTTFTLGGGSGYVGLAKNNGGGGYTTVSSYNYLNQRTDVSFGIINGGPATGYIPWPTPGGPNMGGVPNIVKGDTHFDVDRGIKLAPFTLNITKDETDPASFIRYTTDGSVPTLTNGSTYTAGIPISITTIVRAAAFKPNAIPTNADTQTYIFTADVLTQNTVTAVSKGWPNTTTAGQYFDFGMDSAIITGHETEVQDALKAIPTVSLVTDIANFTDPTCGIFVESQARGRAYERNCSVELLNDKGDLTGNFQIDCGVRSRGGFSRSDNNPKHSWHLYFRNDPGYEGKLNYPLYGTEGTDSFSQVDLATANNYSWSYAPENGNLRQFAYTTPAGVANTLNWRYNTFIRDIVARDTQIAISGAGSRNKYVHLYLNGQYWGLSYIQERAESAHNANYLGGDKDNWDVVKSGGNANTAATYTTEATDGDYTGGILGTATADGTYVSAWAKLYGGGLDLRQRQGNTVSQAADDDRNVRFYKLMGMDFNPSTKVVTRNIAYPVLLDMNQLTDYMLLTFYCGAYDAPLSTFIVNASNNWFAARDRTGSRGFVYYVWDFEHGMGTDMLSATAFTTGTATDINYNSAVTDTRFVAGTGAPNPGFRSTNRLGPWGGASIVPRYFIPTNQQYLATSATTWSTTNAEFYQSSDQYNTNTTYPRSNPQYLHENLAFASEYRRLFADRAQCVLRQGGPLTTAKVIAGIDKRAAQLTNAVIAESARWGNAKGVVLSNYDKNAWLGAVQNLKDWVLQGSNQHYLNSLQIRNPAVPTSLLPGVGSTGPGRAEVLIGQLRAYRDGGLNNANTATDTFWVVNGLFPGVDAPELSQYGGVVANPFNLTVTNPVSNASLGVIYYTLDGSDPQPAGGGAPTTPNTVASGGSITLTATSVVHVRVYNSAGAAGNQWSALAKAEFIVGVTASATNVAITEINYNPKTTAPALGTPTAGDYQTFEFIEIMNTSAGPVDLSGAKFTTGIDYTFANGKVLAAGQRLVIVKDPTAFATRYPDASYPGLSAKVVGPYAGNLSNGGEQVVLSTVESSPGVRAIIRDITYDDNAPWPTSADGDTGQGRTTFLLSPTTNVSALATNNGNNWPGHALIGGNPGGPDYTNFAAWAAANTIAGGAPGSDAEDSDGANALLEYALGSDPSKWTGKEMPGANTAMFTVDGIPDRYLTFSYTRSTSAPDVVYAVQTSSDLNPATWNSSGATWVSTTPNADGTETLVYRANIPVNDMTTTRLYMKVLVTIP